MKGHKKVIIYLIALRLKIYQESILMKFFVIVLLKMNVAINEMIFYSDDDHLSIDGSRLFVKHLKS